MSALPDPGAAAIRRALDRSLSIEERQKAAQEAHELRYGVRHCHPGRGWHSHPGPAIHEDGPDGRTK